ncbi:nucleobase-ascorbate transporter 7-like [Vicia villosa]|uniref:nucleobase-ascorbate transporter 7-like n=1 Tax=Vicia villosa TaxID=3911 RepID=UPI00273BCCAE|nr:nucleobase-ascorbate transporter 7-like [Vicia villosa]
MVIQRLLVVAGANMLVQSFFGTRLLVVISPSNTFVSITLLVVLAGRYKEIADPLRDFTDYACNTRCTYVCLLTVFETYRNAHTCKTDRVNVIRT